MWGAEKGVKQCQYWDFEARIWVTDIRSDRGEGETFGFDSESHRGVSDCIDGAIKRIGLNEIQKWGVCDEDTASYG